MIRPNFEYRHAMMGLKVEQCQRNAHVVVKAGLTEKGGVLLTQQRRQQFFGGCLAVGTRDRHKWDLEILAVSSSQLTQGGPGIGHRKDPNGPTQMRYSAHLSARHH